MAGKNTAVFGIYRDRLGIDNAVHALKDGGFRNTDISVLFPENEGTKDFANVKGTKAAEGAVSGAGAGAVIGGTLGWLAAIGALAIPGVGPLVAAGPVVAALAGVGAGGTVGGLAGTLVGMWHTEYLAKRFGGRIKSGGILLSVHSDDPKWTGNAKKILQSTGADHISSSGEAKADFQKSDKPMLRVSASAAKPMARSEQGRPAQIEQKIRARADELCVQRSGANGHADEDWLRAESEIVPAGEVP